MRDADSAAFAVALVAVAEVYAEALSQARIEAYFAALAPWDLASVLEALQRSVRACKFFPKPADLVELIEGDPKGRAELAWTRVVKATEHVGTYESVDFRDPAIHATVTALGGWTECWRWERLNPRELDMKAQEFKRLYAALRASGGDGPPRLTGLSEVEQVRAGHVLPGQREAVVIGPRGLPEAKRPALPEPNRSAMLTDGATR